MTTAARTRVAMVIPHHGTVCVGVADLRATPDGSAERVDQAHFGERLTVLGGRDGWVYVQGEDHYFGWIRSADLLQDTTVVRGPHIVTSLFADVHERPDGGSDVIARVPVGTRIHETARDGWLEVGPFPTARSGTGFIAVRDVTSVLDLPHRTPTGRELVATARAFLGTPYLWGGTSGDGIDCSGFVQQVYRLNGVGLDRDADQQALEGRPIDAPIAGDLLFFGAPAVTHVALSLGGDEFIHAPMRGGAVEERRTGPDRTPVSMRRYLLEDVVAPEQR
ncbi:MAG TPA: C40 family peptidase [Candidatus Limnocylindria bacterium]|nr:C40 family peptidase [Candidatus Limnocylindria bacterium]